MRAPPYQGKNFPEKISILIPNNIDNPRFTNNFR